MILRVLRRGGHVLVLATDPHGRGMVETLMTQVKDPRWSPLQARSRRPWKRRPGCAVPAVQGGGTPFPGVRRSRRVSFCVHRWVAGTLTNWSSVAASLLNYGLVERDAAATVEEVRRYDRLKERYTGFLQPLPQEGSPTLRLGEPLTLAWTWGLPDLLVVLNPQDHAIAMAEAHRLTIPVVAFTDSRDSVTHSTLAIPMNPHNIHTLRALLGMLVLFAHLPSSPRAAVPRKERVVLPGRCVPVVWDGYRRLRRSMQGFLPQAPVPGRVIMQLVRHGLFLRYRPPRGFARRRISGRRGMPRVSSWVALRRTRRRPKHTRRASGPTPAFIPMAEAIHLARLRPKERETLYRDKRYLKKPWVRRRLRALARFLWVLGSSNRVQWKRTRASRATAAASQGGWRSGKGFHRATSWTPRGGNQEKLPRGGNQEKASRGSTSKGFQRTQRQGGAFSKRKGAPVYTDWDRVYRDYIPAAKQNPDLSLFTFADQPQYKLPSPPDRTKQRSSKKTQGNQEKRPHDPVTVFKTAKRRGTSSLKQDETKSSSLKRDETKPSSSKKAG
jgi:hypothetical protein